jgi:hypothetical protein
LKKRTAELDKYNIKPLQLYKIGLVKSVAKLDIMNGELTRPVRKIQWIFLFFLTLFVTGCKNYINEQLDDIFWGMIVFPFVLTFIAFILKLFEKK